MNFGIGMVYQYFMLIFVFIVVENVMFGYEQICFVGMFDFVVVCVQVCEILVCFGFYVDLDVFVGDLLVGVQ